MSDSLALQERALMRGEEVAEGTLASLRNWFPVTLAGGQVGWREVGEKRFIEPFFSDSLAGLPRRFCLTGLGALDQFAGGLAPTAFIFHVSRCGSTLLTQAAATLPHCVVLSEPPVLDAFLRQQGAAPLDDAAITTLRQLVAALGQRRNDGERALVIKLDCWHLHHLASFRRAFPATPFLFLYREPGAVLASHRRRRGPQMVPGMIDPARLGIDASALAPADLDGYACLVLESLFEGALAQAEAYGLELVNYTELNADSVPALFARLGISCSEAELVAVRDRLRFHSKEGGLPFAGDPAGGMQGAGEALELAYARLEQARMKDFHVC